MTEFEKYIKEQRMQLDSIPPGFRMIELSGTGLQTRVIRLPELTYPPALTG